MNNSYSLTIAVLSHNHKDTVKKAIESILSQQTDYSYELLLFDDASTDGTQDILKDYYQQHPEKITLFLFEQSEGPVLRAKQIYEHSSGKYLTWLDGDDYWTYPQKIQTQLDFLETHPEYNGCFHDASIVSSVDTNENKELQHQTLKKYKYYSQFNHYETEFKPYHLIMRNIIPTASLVIRMASFDDFFSRYHFPPYSFSWAFQLYVIRNSKFYFINECWSVYYDHANGMSKKIAATEFTVNNIRVLKWYKHDSFYKKFRNNISLSIAREYEMLTYNNGRTRLKYGFLMQYYYFVGWGWILCWYLHQVVLTLTGKRK